MEPRLVEVVSPVHGTVSSVERGVGRRVDRRSAVVTIQCEQTRVAIEAGVVGVVDEVRAVVGDNVEPGEVLVVVDASSDVGAGLLARVFDNDVQDALVDDVQDALVDDGDGLHVGTELAIVCTRCGADTLEPGFIEDTGQASQGFARWVEGHLEIGLFGPRRMGRQRLAVEAYRCVRCSHLELFATDAP